MSLFKNSIKNIEGPNYKYIDHIKYPVDFPVKSTGGIDSNTMSNDISALIYYINTLVFSNNKDFVNSPYKTVNTLNGPIDLKKWRETGGVLGDRYYIVIGKCKNGKPKKLYIDNKTGFKDWELLGIPKNAFGKDGFNGLIPGIIQNVYDINPFQIYEMASGKSKLIECFSNKNRNYLYIIIFSIISITVLYLIKNFK